LRFRALVFAGLRLVAVMGTMGAGAGAQIQQSSLSDELSQASAEYGVPKELLLAMGYVNTRWEMPPPTASNYEAEDPEGRGNYGIMALVQNPSRDTLGRAASLTDLSKEQLKTDRASNVRGGAAVLSEMAGENRPSDLNGWYDAVSQYGGGALYADQVYEVLKSGASADTSTGEHLVLAPQSVDVPPLFGAQATGDYPGSTWYGNGGRNYTNSNRESSYNINTIVIHVTQGSWSSAINWFASPSNTGSSAHYTVRSSDGFIGQSVHEEDIAWHAGWWTTNTHSIGIEHEGYINEPKWFTDAMYRSSAKLSAYLARKYDIPIDRQHIIGHNEVPGCPGAGGGANCHTDPGRYWNWTKYMDLVRGYATSSGGSGNTYTQVVDNATSGRFRASDRWILSSYHSATDYGKNYRVLKRPLAVSDNAEYKIKTPAKDSYAVYGWWPTDAGYNWRTTFKIQTASGWVNKTVSQQTNGGRWVSLGTHVLGAGDSYRVEVSSKSPGKGYIIADAIKVVRK
jgi:hypothetical protein